MILLDIKIICRTLKLIVTMLKLFATLSSTLKCFT